MSEMFVCFFLSFSYSSSFPIKILATFAKIQKMDTGPNLCMTDECFRGSV